MVLWPIAWRNVRRHRRRSALTVLAVAIGVGAVVLLHGLSKGFEALMLAEVVDGRTGALQVHRAGYLESLDVVPTSMHFGYAPALVAQVSGVPGVAHVSGRIRFDGSASNGRSDVPLLGRGVDLTQEPLVCPGFGRDVLPTGRSLGPADVGAAVLGAELGRLMHERDITLTATSPAGRLNALGAKVVGLSSLRLPFENKRSVVVPLQLAQQLVGLPGEVTELGVSLLPGADVDQVAAGLRDALGPSFEVHTWRELEPYVRDTLRRQRTAIELVGLVLLLIVLTGISSTLTMSVHERLTEIGTMLALGLRRRQVLWLFVLEAALLGAAGALLGALVGAATVAGLGAHGVALKVLDSAVTLRPRFDVSSTAVAVAIAAGGAVLAALVQARRAARLDPVEALREG